MVRKMKKTLKCAICRHRLPTVNSVRTHYRKNHGKIQIVRQLLGLDLLKRSTPTMLVKKRKKRAQKPSENDRKPEKIDPETMILYKDVYVTYNKESNTLVIQDESGENNLFEFTVDESNSCELPLVTSTHNNNNNNYIDNKNDVLGCTVQGSSASSLNRLQLSFSKILTQENVPQTLDHETGRFYECHCMEKDSMLNFVKEERNEQDDREVFEVEVPNVFMCSTCRACYGSLEDLALHERIHWVYCKICNRYFTFQGFKEHFEQHVVRIYACHICRLEFISKQNLAVHVDCHFEQQVFNDVIDMERDYTTPPVTNDNNGHLQFGRFSNVIESDDPSTYKENIDTFMLYLAYPHDHNYYCKNLFFKVICDICRGDFYIFDFESHLKTVHYLP